MSVQQSAMRTLPAPRWNKASGEQLIKTINEGSCDEPGNGPHIATDQGVSDGPCAGDADLLAAQAEWDAVETVVPDLPGRSHGDEGHSENVHRSLTVTFDEAFESFKTVDLSQYKDKIHTSVERHGFAAFTHFCFGPPKLSRSLHEERDLMFCIAACPFDNQQPVHLRVLQTVYKALTGSKFDCPRFGDHWDQIGFQGNDPATDLRGSGFLGLLHLLYFVTSAKTSSLAKDVYKLSLHQSQNFPFAVMSINMTKIAIQTLREDNLNKECNRQGAIINVLNDFYAGTYLHLYLIWKQQHKTIADSGFVLKEVESFCKKHAVRVIKNLDEYLTNKGPDSKQSGTSKDELVFTKVEDMT